MLRSPFRRVLSVALLLSVAWAVVASSGETLEGQARKAGKPLIVDFGMTRCAQCIEEARVMDRLKGTLGEKALFRFVHVGKEEQTAADCKILLIPAIVFYDRKGKEVFRNVGFMDYEAVLGKIKEVRLLD